MFRYQIMIILYCKFFLIFYFFISYLGEAAVRFIQLSRSFFRS